MNRWQRPWIKLWNCKSAFLLKLKLFSRYFSNVLLNIKFSSSIFWCQQQRLALCSTATTRKRVYLCLCLCCLVVNNLRSQTKRLPVRVQLPAILPKSIVANQGLKPLNDFRTVEWLSHVKCFYAFYSLNVFSC